MQIWEKSDYISILNTQRQDFFSSRTDRPRLKYGTHRLHPWFAAYRTLLAAESLLSGVVWSVTLVGVCFRSRISKAPFTVVIHFAFCLAWLETDHTLSSSSAHCHTSSHAYTRVYMPVCLCTLASSTSWHTLLILEFYFILFLTIFSVHDQPYTHIHSYCHDEIHAFVGDDCRPMHCR